MFFRKRKSLLSGHHPDYIILGALFFLLLAGFLILSSASSDLGKIKFNDTYHFIKGQFLKGFLPGVAGFLLGYFIYYRYLKKFAPFLFLINIFLLVAVFTPLGYQAHGSFRWINLGPLSFQPSEFLKITFIIYLASLLSSSHMKNLKQGWKAYFLFVFVCAIAGGLIFLQPATTMAVIILASGVVMYIYSGAPVKQLLLTGLIGVVLIGFLVAVTPYRFYRFAPFWNSTIGGAVPSFKINIEATDTFHIDQSKMAIGSGGLTGVGFGQSTSKYNLLPEPMGDSIFAVIGEEFGFIGSVFIIFLYALIFWKGTYIVKKSHDDFAKLCVLGFISVISIQAIIHIAANSGLLPFTGVPLPLISYGGTSLAVTLTMFGIIAGISKRSSLI
ncbi:MAG: putative peptidoglycan glycosyltransferase FtsW [Candidatus Paceibacterota bacterium]|jgi:cell division protein FtsW